MGIDIAVSPSTKTPGLYLKVNLLAGVSSPGTALLRGLVMCPCSSAGNLTQDTEVRLLASAEDAKTAFGTKTPGYLLAAAFFAAHPRGVLYANAPTRSGGSPATGTVTFANTPTSARTARITIAGKVVDVPWAASESATVVAARAVLLVNARPDVPVTATSSEGVLTLTAPIAGPWGNDILLSVQLLDGAGGTATASAVALAGGTTEPDFTTALTAVSNTKFDYIGACLSNADAQGAGATTNVARLRTHINSLNTGLNAMLQQGIVASTGTLAAAKAGAIARNEPTIELVHCMAGQGLPAELCGAEMGSRMASVEIDPAANRIGTVLQFAGAADLVADKPTPAEIEDALANGVSICSYNAQGEVVMVRPITSHSQDANGNPDNRCFDISGVDGEYAIANDLETFLPQRFYQCKVSRDIAPDEEPLTQTGVVEERDIKAEIVTRLRYWVGRGVARRDKLDDAVANGTLIVKVNDADESQVDIVIPSAIYKPLAKMGVVINKVA